MKRDIDKTLQNWKSSTNRKVLLIRGARQIGKTYSIRDLGKTFDYFLEINFEEEVPVKSFFTGSLNPAGIIEKLSAYFSIPIIEGKTLLFFDEIQACPNAIKSLRFFYEKIPSLHVAAAGSLLEFALSEIPSFGVGRLHSVFMYPLSFIEFLQAIGQQVLIDYLKGSNGNPIDLVFHNKLLDYFRTFLIIGGMPEVVKEYKTNKNLLMCNEIINDIAVSLKDDFSKYKKHAPVGRLTEVFNSIAYQSGSKFKYSNIESESSHAALKDSLDLLVKAGLVYKVYHTAGTGIPLGAQIKANKFKLIGFDTGIIFKILGLNMSDILVGDSVDLINKGSIAEIFTCVEIIKSMPSNNKPEIFYWHREKKGSNAEVDFVIQKNKHIIPIEVKSGSTGKMQSLRSFMSEKNSKLGIRLSLENFGAYGDIQIIPLYAAGTILKD
ncbi:MAG: ATP-binding protein [Spirochaetales bacterium]|nr:ATP-binding protein [Spirochaetales bacterium]